MIHFMYHAGATRHIATSHTAKSTGIPSHHTASFQPGSDVKGRYGPVIAGSGRCVPDGDLALVDLDSLLTPTQSKAEVIRRSGFACSMIATYCLSRTRRSEDRVQR